MLFRLSCRAAALAAAVSLEALLLAGPALAQNVQIFDQAPSIEELRQILIPETRPGGLTRKIEIPRRDTIAGAPMARPASAVADETDPTSMAPPPPPIVTQTPAPPASAAVEAPASASAGPSVAAAMPPSRPIVRPPTPSRADGAVPAAAPAPKAGAADAVGFRINFALNSTIIPSEYEPYVDRIGELMRQEPALELLVEGHTDALGSDGYNLKLSEKRAIAVGRYLVVRHGIDPERLRVAGKGKSEPLMEDPYDPRNRRVQFLRVE